MATAAVSGEPQLRKSALGLWDDTLKRDSGRESAQRSRDAVGRRGARNREQLWERDSLAEGWSLPSGSMGRRDTGTEMADAEAELIAFPEQSEVVDYARRVFTFAEDAIAAIPDELLLEVAKDDPDGDTNLDNVIIYHEHLSRHLGMIEAIRGLQGLSGSASR